MDHATDQEVAYATFRLRQVGWEFNDVLVNFKPTLSIHALKHFIATSVFGGAIHPGDVVLVLHPQDNHYDSEPLLAQNKRCNDNATLAELVPMMQLSGRISAAPSTSANIPSAQVGDGAAYTVLSETAPESESATNKAASDEGSIASKHGSKTNLSRKDQDANLALGVFSLQFVRASSPKHAKPPDRSNDSNTKVHGKKIHDIYYSVRSALVSSNDQPLSSATLSNTTNCPLLTFTLRGNLRTGLPPSAITSS